MVKTYNCIDAGSEFCPCNLTNTMDCISCSHLRGEDFCDCNWNGVCILYEYYMQNKEPKNFRKTYAGFIVDKIKLEEKLFLLKIQLDKELLNELDRTGAYVFIKKFEYNNYYEMPMSVFYLDQEYVYLVYQELGSKTKSIGNGEKLTVRGPYWNGIIGEHKLSNIENSNTLIIARGMGQSSILLPIRELAKKRNKITLILDKGKLNSFYCLDYIFDTSIKIEIFDLFSDEGKKMLKKIIEGNNIDLIFSSGSEMLHREVSSIIGQTEKIIKFFVTNNNILCCGEGICGSCMRKIKNGERIKFCKTMIDPKNIY